MVKHTCRNCEFSTEVEKKEKDLAKVTGVIIANKDLSRRQKLVEIGKLPDAGQQLMKRSRGIENMPLKPVAEERRGGTEYIKCPNADHLKDEKADGYEFVVHKYYFACKHFEEGK